MFAEEFYRALCSGTLPKGLQNLFKDLETPVGVDLFDIANSIGALEPLAFLRPSAGDIVEVYDKSVTVDPATFAPDGVTVIPTDRKLIEICCPDEKILVVKTLRGAAADLTASEFGEILMKRMAVMGFSEGFCPAGEPGDGDDFGTIQNIEHVILVPKAGFDVTARNHSPYGPATFSIHAEMWTTC